MVCRITEKCGKDLISSCQRVTYRHLHIAHYIAVQPHRNKANRGLCTHLLAHALKTAVYTRVYTVHIGYIDHCMRTIIYDHPPFFHMLDSEYVRAFEIQMVVVLWVNCTNSLYNCMRHIVSLVHGVWLALVEKLCTHLLAHASKTAMYTRVYTVHIGYIDHCMHIVQSYTITLHSFIC